jgi:murein DD-endopeptidase MepM/ murein hydrolase activator NlpD
MKRIVAIALALVALTSSSAAFSDTSRTELLKINDQIVAKKQQIADLAKQIKASQAQIESLQNSADTLENEIAILDNQVVKNDLDIQSTQAQIEAITLELADLDIRITASEQRISSDRDLLGSLIRQIAREDDRSALQAMFLSENLSAIFERAKQLTDLQGDMLGTVKRLEEEKAGLVQQQAEESAKNDELRKQKDRLAIAKVKLEEARDSKQLIMERTRNSESRYQDLVSSLRDESESVSSDLVSLEAQARARLAANDRFPTGDVILSWPVPSRAVRSIFHDPDYPFRRIMEHSGIDIGSTPQGTPVRAAAPGYILKAKDAGYGYSYIIILHANGISTVYGHLSRETVSADSYVERGEIIGYSGGMPGTRGAGSMTTGPHLHFEVRVNGIPTDPLDYLVD